MTARETKWRRSIWACDRSPALVPSSEETAELLRDLALAQDCTVQDVVDLAVQDYHEVCPLPLLWKEDSPQGAVPHREGSREEKLQRKQQPRQQ